MNFLTHNKGDILDLVCCSVIAPYNPPSVYLPICDHNIVLFDSYLPLRKSEGSAYYVIRNIMQVLPENFVSLIKSYLSPSSMASSVELVEHYKSCLSSAINILAPLRTLIVSFSYSTPWFTPEVRQLKAMDQQLERLSKKMGLIAHNEMYSDHILQYKNTFSAAKTTYYSNIITKYERKTRAHFPLQ